MSRLYKQTLLSAGLDTRGIIAPVVLLPTRVRCAACVTLRASAPKSARPSVPISRMEQCRRRIIMTGIFPAHFAWCGRQGDRHMRRLEHPHVTYAWILLLAILGGCSSLPTIVPDMARRPHQPIQLAGASGPLSAEQSKKILQRLGNGGQPTNIFDRHLALEEAIVGSPQEVGNMVTRRGGGPGAGGAGGAAGGAAGGRGGGE